MRISTDLFIPFVGALDSLIIETDKSGECRLILCRPAAAEPKPLPATVICLVFPSVLCAYKVRVFIIDKMCGNFLEQD